jgi:hypothetical protein
MCSQSENRLENLLIESQKLRENLENFFPSYVAALNRLSQVPTEFERRYWVSRLDLFLEKVSSDYKKYQAEVNKANFMGQFMGRAMDVMMQAGRLGPISPLSPLEGCLAIWPSGKIEPTYKGATSKQSEAVLVRFEEFEKLTQKLKDGILKGMVTLKSEDEIPNLIGNLARGIANNQSQGHRG